MCSANITNNLPIQQTLAQQKAQINIYYYTTATQSTTRVTGKSFILK